MTQLAHKLAQTMKESQGHLPSHLAYKLAWGVPFRCLCGALREKHSHFCKECIKFNKGRKRVRHD